MKRIRKCRATRFLSWVLTVAMLAPLLTGTVAPRAAYAQQPSAAAPGGTQTVIVIDFVNKSGTGGDALARFATDAVAVELANSNRFDVLKREEVTREANNLGLRPPYDSIALSRIGSALGASAVVTGEIAYVRVDAKANPRTVVTGLKVRVQEATSGDIVNGAAQVGTAAARPGVSDEATLAQEAVSNAAFKAVREILAYNLPEGTVLNIVGSPPNVQVLINRGSRDGIKIGMELIILRDRQRVGRIRITDVFPTDSEALILENTLGIRPEDKARAVFPEPTFNDKGEAVRTDTRKARRTGDTLGKVLLVLAIGAIIATAAGGNNSTTTGVTAEPFLQNNSPAVRIVWRDNLFAGTVLEYHIWRSPDDPFNFTGTPVAATGAGQRQYIDQPAPFSFWDGIRSFLQAPDPTNTGGGGGGTTGGTASSVTPDAGEVSGFTTGRTVTYQVSSIVRRQVTTNNNNQGGGTNNTFEDIESTPVSSGPATPINQPILTNPLDQVANVNIGGVNFSFQSQAGADEYVVEVSTDRTFKNPGLIQQFGPVFTSGTSGQTVNLPNATNLTTSQALRRDPVFLAFVNGAPGAATPTLYWRVGARNSQDRPGPMHFITQDPKDRNRTFRFIYSQPRTFTPATLPPPPP